jgi:hypothetical protein
VKLLNRIAQLETVTAERQPLRDAMAEFRAECRRWERAADEVERLLGGAGGLRPVISFLRREFLAELPDLLGPAIQGDQTAARRLAVIRRVPTATVRLFDRLPPDLRPLAASATAMIGTPSGPPWSGDLIRAVAGLECRIPPHVEPAVLGAVVAHRSGRPRGEVTEVTCSGCGLQRPVVMAANCPHCGNGEVSPPHTDEADVAWRVLAAEELDPPVGRRWAKTT